MTKTTVLCALLLSAAGRAAAAPLIIASGGKTTAVVCVAASGPWEARAAADLATYIGRISGATPAVITDPPAIAAAIAGQAPCLIVGHLALQQRPQLQQKLREIADPEPVAAADAIAVVRDGNRVYLAGTTDVSHYHAVSWLLHHWGCRWYLPTAIGECIPSSDQLSLDDLEHYYAPPFEVRNYWISWNGSTDGQQEFQLRNFMNLARPVGMGHALDHYTQDLAPAGGSVFNVPFSDPATAQHVATQVMAKLAENPNGVSLAIADGVYSNDYAGDAKLVANIEDKYFLKPNMTDPMMALYSNVGQLLDAQNAPRPGWFGALAYANVTLPPQWQHRVPDRLLVWLAPIDIDPNHGYNHPDSPPRQEYGEMLRRWATLMNGRVCIYDYDQGMLVWRDVPNPSHQAFRHDVKLYRDAGILGISTESRNAIATVFINLHLRGQLMWDPDLDVDARLEEFYSKFYGPIAEPMARFWRAIFAAWDETIVTEHEYFAIPAIYPPALVQQLGRDLAAAGELGQHLDGVYRGRLEMAQAMFRVLRLYTTMVSLAATEADYAGAAKLGVELIEARLQLARLNPTFTTRVVGPAADPTEPKGSAAWLPGEVKQYQQLAELTAGNTGELIARLPLVWAFHRDPHDTGLVRGWGYNAADLSYWQANHDQYDVRSLKDYPTTEWEMLRTDLYAQAQGVRHPDGQSFTGHLWYKTPLQLTAEQTAGKVRLRFPGLFNECWLYLNGYLVAHRPMGPMWWLTDYTFEWDVDLSGKLRAGENEFTVHCYNPHHFGGIFRRPFLYRPKP